MKDRNFSDRMERARALVEAGVALDIATALLIADAKPTPVIVEVVEDGVVRKLTDDPECGQG